MVWANSRCAHHLQSIATRGLQMNGITIDKQRRRKGPAYRSIDFSDHFYHKSSPYAYKYRDIHKPCVTARHRGQLGQLWLTTAPEWEHRPVSSTRPAAPHPEQGERFQVIKGLHMMYLRCGTRLSPPQIRLYYTLTARTLILSLSGKSSVGAQFQGWTAPSSSAVGFSTLV